MTSDHLVPLVMAGVLGFLHPAFGDPLSQASYQVGGDVTASGVHTDGLPNNVDVPFGGSGLQADLTGGSAIEIYNNDSAASTDDAIGHAQVNVGLSALAKIGRLSVTAFGSVNASGAVNASGTSYDQATAHIGTLDVDALFTDEVVVTAPHVSLGSPLLVHGGILLFGSLSGSVAGPSDPNDGAGAGYTLYLGLGHTTGAPPSPIGGTYYGLVSGDTDITVGVNRQPEGRSILTNIEAESGVPIPLTVELEVTVGPGNIEASVGRTPHPISVASSFNGDYGNTLRWGGIMSVTDLSTGLPVDDWTITSASGFDYSKAAPEPEPATIVLAAIAGLAAIARRMARPRTRQA